MRILIDILHPAHVHFYRNFYEEMAGRGHELTITARDKDRSVDLLEQYDLPYEQISVQKSGAVGMVTEMTQRTGALMKVMGDFQPDVMTGIMGPSIALAGAMKRVPAVVFYDTEFARADELVRVPARAQRRHARLLPGQGARHPRPLRGLPRARVPAPEPVPARPREARGLRRRARRAVLDRAVRLVAGGARPERDRADRRAEARPRRASSSATVAC